MYVTFNAYGFISFIFSLSLSCTCVLASASAWRQPLRLDLVFPYWENREAHISTAPLIFDYKRLQCGLKYRLYRDLTMYLLDFSIYYKNSHLKRSRRGHGKDFTQSPRFKRAVGPVGILKERRGRIPEFELRNRLRKRTPG